MNKLFCIQNKALMEYQNVIKWIFFKYGLYGYWKGLKKIFLQAASIAFFYKCKSAQDICKQPTSGAFLLQKS